MKFYLLYISHHFSPTSAQSELVATTKKRNRICDGDHSDRKNSPASKPAKQRRGSYDLAQVVDNLVLQNLKEEFRRHAALEKKLLVLTRRNLKKMQVIQADIASLICKHHDRCHHSKA